MKRIGKWLLGLITSALTLVLVIVLLPYAAKWVARIMPDESAAAIRASVVLSQKLEQSAKLETLHVTEEGALNYEVKAAFLGTVASINADYTYEGSFGIDLQQVTMTRDGSVLTLTLPAPELLLDALLGTAERGTSFLSAGQANGEYGFHFGSGTYAAAVIRVDVPDAESYQDGYRILLRHALEIVRRESGLLTEEFAASLGHAGIAVLLYLRAYHAVEVTQCFTKIRKEIENQRDLFWNVQATVCLGSRRDSLEQAGESMREALWLCRDRLCRPQSWRDAALEMPDLARRYQMDASRKKSFQVAAECLDEVRFVQELEESCRTVEALPDLNGQMVEDWFRQVLEACLYGMRQSGETEAPLEEEMDKRFWHCTDMAAVYRLLRQGIQAEIQRLKEAKALREMRPITEAKHYIQQHYQEALRLEDVSTAVGFNATYFSTLFKKETGQNFMDYLTELRISKAKELLCGEELSVQDVAEQVGYRDLKYFSRLFKKLTGVSPSDYKKLYK